jgi:hypothetical protein
MINTQESFLKPNRGFPVFYVANDPIFHDERNQEKIQITPQMRREVDKIVLAYVESQSQTPNEKIVPIPITKKTFQQIVYDTKVDSTQVGLLKTIRVFFFQRLVHLYPEKTGLVCLHNDYPELFPTSVIRTLAALYGPNICPPLNEVKQYVQNLENEFIGHVIYPPPH